jgi:hypothetical protein
MADGKEENIRIDGCSPHSHSGPKAADPRARTLDPTFRTSHKIIQEIAYD